MNRRQLLTTLGILIPVAGLSLPGCEKRREPVDLSPLMADESEYKVTLLLDLSGSFVDLMAKDGKAYEFAKQIIDKYFRDRVGTSDELIIAQISGTERALLWQGRPQDLFRDFPNVAAFRDFLESHADPRGSRVHEAITQAVEYLMSDATVASGKARSAVFVLSDMEQNSLGDKEAAKNKTLDALSKYGKCGGVVGLYYVDQLYVPEWRGYLHDAGIKSFCVEADILGRPRLPNFE